MKKPEHHIFVCSSFRANGSPQGVCVKGGLLQYIEEQIAEREMDGVLVTSTGCLKVCDRGPALVVYPENWWYGGVSSEEKVDSVLDSIEKGEPNAEMLIA